MKRSTTLIVFAAILLLSAIAFAEVPERINYQGYLADSTGQAVEDGVYQMVFTIYNAEDAPIGIWSSGTRDVMVEKGLFEYKLGSYTPLYDSIFADTNRWLGVRIVGDDEISPRTEFITVPYAYQSLRADSAGYASAGGGWVDDGSTVRLMTSDDKVGIGTSSPTSKLQVMAAGTDKAAYFQAAGQTCVEAYMTAQPGTYNTYAVYGHNSGGDGHNKGLYGLASQGYMGTGVLGIAWGNSQASVGVMGEVDDDAGGAEYHWGVYGRAEDALSENCGVYGRATGSAEVNYGMYGLAVGATVNWAGYFEGNVNCTDTVKTTSFTMATGASDGYVLTSDANGNGTWQASGFRGSDADAFDGRVNSGKVEDGRATAVFDFENAFTSAEKPHMFVSVVLTSAAAGLAEGAALRTAVDIKGSPGNWTGFGIAVSKPSGGPVSDAAPVFVTWMAVGR